MNLLNKLLNSLSDFFCHSKDEESDTIEVAPEKDSICDSTQDEELNEAPNEAPNEALNINAKTFTNSKGEVFQADKSSYRGSLFFKDANLLFYLGKVMIDLNNVSSCKYKSRDYSDGMICYIERDLDTESGKIKKNINEEWMGPSQDDYVAYNEDKDYRYLTFYFKDGESLVLDDDVYDYDYEVWNWLEEIFCTKNSENMEA